MVGKVALAGCGRWGANHLKTLQGLGWLEIACDTDESRLAQLREQDVRCTSDFSSMLEMDSVNHVAIATPASTHYELTKQAILAGKDVFVEKPLALKVEQGAELVRLAEQQSVILMVGHILLHDLVVERLLDELSRGEIGEVVHVKSNRLNFGTIRREENALWSLGVHDVSIGTAIFNNELPQLVQCAGQAAVGSVDDFSCLNLLFSEGRTMTINVSWLHPYRHRELIVVGTRGFIIYDAAKKLEDQLKIIYSETHPDNHDETSVPAAVTGERKFSKLDLVGDSEFQSPLEREYRHFLQCCETRSQPSRTDGVSALNVLRILDAADQSRIGGKSIAPADRRTPPPTAPYFAHETAVIDDGAHIGEGTKIWHFSHVMKGARLGESCNLGQNVLVASTAVLGKNVKVQNNVSVYDGVICEDNVFIGPSAVFTNVKNPRSEIQRKSEYRRTVVRSGATIGANATIVCGVELGRYCFVGAGAVVTKDVSPYRVVYGNPAHEHGLISPEGNILTEETSARGVKYLQDSVGGKKYVLSAQGDSLILVNP
mmetsp:Transcript_12419/g.37888  ORF Transcript_12419/g.37888 Transcript_12419/m.37888 type:complete len:543 (+) Transcript_12419:58-1686(+)